MYATIFFQINQPQHYNVHIYITHLCIKKWLKNNFTCPTCRKHPYISDSYSNFCKINQKSNIFLISEDCDIPNFNLQSVVIDDVKLLCINSKEVKNINPNNFPNLEYIEIIGDNFEIDCLQPCLFLNKLKLIKRTKLPPLFEFFKKINSLCLVYSQPIQLYLHYFANVKELTFVNSNLQSLEGISSLTKLKELNLNCNLIYNLDGIEKLNLLEILYLDDNPFRLIHQLQNLRNLKFLSLDNCKNIETVYFLKNLFNLEKIFLFNTKVLDFYPLIELKKLNTLRVEQYKVFRLNCLQHLPNLTYNTSLTSSSDDEDD